MADGNLRIRMSPDIAHFRQWENGIARVVEAYTRLLPVYGIQVAGPDASTYDLHVVHAGTAPGADVAICHGLYWTADYNSDSWEWHANHDVITSVRSARAVTVPSRWVAETFQRDMHLSPAVIGHGIDWRDWQAGPDTHSDYVLWAKNRTGDVCDPRPVAELARRFPQGQFVTTFAASPLRKSLPNVKVTGLLPRAEAVRTIQSAMLYLSTTKETFGITTLEALASGVPVLGFAHGGNLDLVQHGVNGYLAKPGDYDDLADGLRWCAANREMLSANARELAKAWTWERAVEKLAVVLLETARPLPPTIAVIIPCYNYGEKVRRALASVAAQTLPANEIVVVDDGSDTDQSARTRAACEQYRARYLWKPNGGVATARNAGIAETHSKYLCCLDADDALEPEFLRVCVEALEADHSLAIAYTGLQWVKPDGTTGLSQWPGDYSCDEQIQGRNQIPTCCVFRRTMWERLGGYRQRYAPAGQGEEDAEFWLRAGAIGHGACKVHAGGLFTYSWLSGRTSGSKSHTITDWRGWHPWTHDHHHPFASLATPVNKISHAVRQYDEPLVSVIIPVGPGHEVDVVNALDSLEAQSERKWEVILVNDTGQPLPAALLAAYPFARLVETSGRRGAGHARNAGASTARAPFLLFLDADDWLYPTAIERMLAAWDRTGAIVYSDYTGKALIAEKDVGQVDAKLLHYDTRHNEATLEMHATDFDYARALRQPEPGQPYIWCNVTSLVPASWHKEISGFDEQMASWEDWDYWLRMARAGRCFAHIPDPLLVYRFHTGNRREVGLAEYPRLIEYLREKYATETFENQKAETMAKGCGCNKEPVAVAASHTPVAAMTLAATREQSGETPMKLQTAHNGTIEVRDSDMVLCLYAPGRLGNHSVIGPVSRIRYGYRSGNTKFLVHRLDIAAAAHLFKPVENRAGVAVPETKFTLPPTPVAVVPVPAPVPIITPAHIFVPASVPAPTPVPANLSLLPGVTPGIALQMREQGITGPTDILARGHGWLLSLRGVGERRAATILQGAQNANGT